MNLLPFFKWCDQSWMGEAIRSVTWAFPLIETIHILAMTVLLGGILMMDLRLLGVAERLLPVSKIQKQLTRYIDVSLVLIIVTGVLLFSSEAVKAYDNAAFFPKMYLLAAAVIYHYTVHRRAVTADNPSGPRWARPAAALSLALWFGVGICGRAIGFV